MTGLKKQPKNEKGKLSYAFIPASLFMGVAVGWTLSHLVTKKTVVTQNRTATEKPQFTLRNRVRETILDIDHELNAEKNAEYRRVLVEFAYRLTDLDLRAKVQKLLS